MNVLGIQSVSFAGNKGKPVEALVRRFNALMAAGGTAHTTKQGVIVYSITGQRVGSFPLRVIV